MLKIAFFIFFIGFIASCLFFVFLIRFASRIGELVIKILRIKK